MDSNAWETDLHAIRDGTAPRHDLWVRYRTKVDVIGSGSKPLPMTEIVRDGWLEIYADQRGHEPLVRSPVSDALDLSSELVLRDLAGWPEPGRCIGLADRTAEPLGPNYPLHRRWFGKD